MKYKVPVNRIKGLDEVLFERKEEFGHDFSGFLSANFFLIFFLQVRVN